MRLRIFIPLLTLLTPFHSAIAGAWLQPKGHGQFIEQASYYTSDKYFDIDGHLTQQPRFTKYEFQPYVEYGLLDNLTVGATGFIQHVNQAGGSNNGIADPELFARTVLWKNNIERISIQPLIKFKSVFESDGSPRGGSRSTDAELSLLYGRNITIISDHDYLDARAGYRYRGGHLNDQFLTDAALGLELMPDWFVTSAIRAITATKYSDTTAFSENGDMDFDLMKVELGTTYKLTPTNTLGITAFTHLYGAQTGSGMGMSVMLMQGF